MYVRTRLCQVVKLAIEEKDAKSYYTEQYSFLDCDVVCLGDSSTLRRSISLSYPRSKSKITQRSGTGDRIRRSHRLETASPSQCIGIMNSVPLHHRKTALI
jgi:hypothetical protein